MNLPYPRHPFASISGLLLIAVASLRTTNGWITSLPTRHHQQQQQHASSQATRHPVGLTMVPPSENTAAAAPATTTSDRTAATMAENLMDALQQDTSFQKEYAKTCHVKIGPSSTTNRLGLIATQRIRKGDVVLGIPYLDQYQLRGDEVVAQNTFKDVLPEAYESWTGSMGLIALQLLEWVALAYTKEEEEKDSNNSNLPAFLTAWVQSLPTPDEMQHHPLFWSEGDQEVLQTSSTRKIYRQLDDLEEDAQWLVENIFAQDRTRFPETVKDNNNAIPCFSMEGFRWAMALAQSRSFFLDGTLRLVPFLDYCNHADDIATVEIQSGSMGTLWGSVKGAQLVADREYKAGEEVFCSYGPKSAADYLMEHGFVPDSCWKTAVSELTFEVDPEDRFYDDKLDILEFETYDLAPMDPSQSFDVVYGGQTDGQPDPAMVQFVRLCQLGAQDAFLLESIFRKDVWGFMELPVSEKNEAQAVKTILSTCQKAVEEFAAGGSTKVDEQDSANAQLCAKLRESESKALGRLIEYVEREQEALDLKEYYQERRLKDLGLDSVWSPEDDLDGDLNYGQTRVPGGADYDW